MVGKMEGERMVFNSVLLRKNGLLRGCIVTMTGRPWYIEELVIHDRANLSMPRPVQWSPYRVTFRPCVAAQISSGGNL